MKSKIFRFVVLASVTLVCCLVTRTSNAQTSREELSKVLVNWRVQPAAAGGVPSITHTATGFLLSNAKLTFLHERHETVLRGKALTVDVGRKSIQASGLPSLSSGSTVSKGSKDTTITVSFDASHILTRGTLSTAPRS